MVLADESPTIRAELLRIAGLLRQRGCRTIGLVPAGAGVEIRPVALRLGLALAELSGRRTGVVDARRARAGERASGPADGDASHVTWVSEQVALVTERGAGERAAAEPDLRAFFGTLEQVVVDLTGFDETGEHLGAIALLDGVAVVARAGRSTADELERWMRDVPPGRNLGVILVDAAP